METGVPLEGSWRCSGDSLGFLADSGRETEGFGAPGRGLREVWNGLMGRRKILGGIWRDIGHRGGVWKDSTTSGKGGKNSWRTGGRSKGWVESSGKGRKGSE